MGRRGQDKAKLDRECQKNLPELKSARDLEYGFKIRCARAAVSCLAWWHSGRKGMPASARLLGLACNGAVPFHVLQGQGEPEDLVCGERNHRHPPPESHQRQSA